MKPAARSLARAGSAGRFVMCIAGVWMAAAGCVPSSFLITPVSTHARLEEQETERESLFARKKIALIDLDGMIQNARSSSLLGGDGENPVAFLKEKLDAARKDPAVKAIVLRINSPGGAVTATDLLYQEIKSFRQKTRIPVVAGLLDVAASGGYYLACACDRIVAMPTTVTGSIGVIMITPDVSAGLSKLGIRMNVIKSGALKDSGSPFRELGEEDRRVFQGLIQGMYERFLGVVQSGRTALSADRVRELADGRVFLGEEALKNGLVDELGDLNAAIDAARRLAGLGDQPIRIVQYARPYGYKPNIYSAGEAPAPQLNLINIQAPLGLNAAPQFMYLWSPGQ